MARRGWRDDQGGELPPDPWAAAAHDRSPPPAPPLAPSSRSSALAHPAFWIVVTLLAAVLLIGALLDRSSRRPVAPTSEPAISTLPAMDDAAVRA